MEKQKEEQSKSRFSWLSAAGAFLIAALAVVAAALGNIDKITNYLFPKHPPKLEVRFAGEATAETTLQIFPRWSDFGYSGFSEALPLPLVIRNIGVLPAENVRVNLVFGPSLSITNNSGEVVAPVHVSALLDVTGYEQVRSLEIDRISASQSYDWLDQNLELEFRLRERVGVPMLENDVPVIKPLWIDFTNSKMGELGKFPIEFTVTADGVPDETGVLIVEIDSDVLSTVQSIEAEKTVSFDLGDGKSAPVLDETETSFSRSIKFFAGTADEFGTALRSGEAPLTVDLVEYELTEFVSDSDQWFEFFDEYGLRYVFVDRDKDLTLDEFYSDLGAADVDGDSDWHLMTPSSRTPYIPLNRILNFSEDAGIFTQSGDILFGNK